MEDTTSPKEYGLVQGKRVMFKLIGTVNPEKKALNSHCMLRQASEMVQSPEVARDKVWVFRLLREAHIWERVTLGGQVGGSDGGDGEGKGRGDVEGEGEYEGKDEGEGEREGEDEVEGDRNNESKGEGEREGNGDGEREDEGEGEGKDDVEGNVEGEGEGEGDGRAVEVGKVGLEDGQLAAQCM